MLFSTSQMSKTHNLYNHPIVILSNEQPIERVFEFKLLGVHFSQNLSWNAHVNKLMQSCMATLRALKQFKRSANYELRKTLVQSLILSKIDFNNVVFSDASLYVVNRLQKIQRAAASFVLGRFCNDMDILQLQWLPIEERISLALVKLVHKSVNKFNNWPSYLTTQTKTQDHLVYVLITIAV